eukprot:scaffold1022_cov307-Pavlova_lutheri.AAC.1
MAKQDTLVRKIRLNNDAAGAMERMGTPCPERPKKGEFWDPLRPATPSPSARRTIQDQESSDSESPRRITRASDEKERGTGLRQRKSPRIHTPPKWRWGVGTTSTSLCTGEADPALANIINR